MRNLKCKIDIKENSKKRNLKIIDIPSSGFLIFKSYDI